VSRVGATSSGWKPVKAADKGRRSLKGKRPALKSLVIKPKGMVLIVDDDPSVLRALTRLVGAAGYPVRAYDRPRALLASTMPHANACMLVDVNLPEMNGVELCRALADSGRGLPVIFLTGKNDPETRRLTQSAHAVETLHKPVDERVLFDAINRALALCKGDADDA
jgi:FixJ family two-component response regulator